MALTCKTRPDLSLKSRLQGLVRLVFVVAALISAGCGGGGGSSSSGSTSLGQLQFSSTSQSWIGWCKLVTVQFLNSSGASTSLSESVTFSITGNQASVYSDSTCSTSASSITASAGSSSMSLYIKPTAVSLNMGFQLNSSQFSTTTYSTTSTQATATTVLGQTNFTSNTANSPSVSSGGLNEPRRIAMLGTKLLVADRANHRVLVYPSLTATAPTQVLGQGDLNTTTDNSPPSGGLLSDPVSVWSDGTRIIVTSKAHNRVLVWNNLPVSDGAAPDYILGQSDSISTSSGSTLSKLNAPEHAFISGTQFFIVDGGNSRILIFNSLPTATGTAADITVGVGSGNASDSFSTPVFATVISNALYVADSGNNRIQVFSSIPSANGASASLSLSLSNVSADPTIILTVGQKLLAYDKNKSRVAFWNSIPTSNVGPDGYIGQADPSSVSTTVDSSTLGQGFGLLYSGTSLWIADSERHRLLKFPTPEP